MRAFLWTIVLVANVAVTAIAGVLALASEAPPIARLVAVVLGVLAGGASVLLVLARSARLPVWAPSAMRVLCIAFPLLWLLGSLDHGILSGQELLSLVLVSALYWGTWRVFRQSSAAAV
jgi:hypothetical protein